MAGCSGGKEESAAPKEEKIKENQPDQESPENEESVYREMHINLEQFVTSYNDIVKDADLPQLELAGNESITAGGLAVSVNDNGTVWGILQPMGATPLSVTSVLEAISEQSSSEDAAKIDEYANRFMSSLDNEELFVEELELESMTISTNASGSDFIMFSVLGEEK